MFPPTTLLASNLKAEGHALVDLIISCRAGEMGNEDADSCDRQQGSLSLSGSTQRHHINSAAPTLVGVMIMGKDEPGGTSGTSKTPIPGECCGGTERETKLSLHK